MNLDKQQKRAVEFYEGQAIVIAGAGSGKTRVLTNRVARLIERDVQPESVLAFTFTNAAADEMKNRLIEMIGQEKVDRLNIGTMHSQLNRILRKNVSYWRPHMYGYEIMDDYGQRKLITETMKACGLPEDSMVNIANAGTVLAHVKNNAWSLQDLFEGAGRDRMIDLGVDDWFVDFFQTYERLRQQGKLVGFDDMLWDTYFLLRERVNVLNTYRQAFKFLLVDEFQDTNIVQFELIKMLQSHHGNLFAVGDPRQAIYSFRGADVSLSLEFTKHFPKAEVIELTHNYRCSGNIVEMSNDLIAHAGYPFSRTKSIKENGEIRFMGEFMDDNGEAEAIAEEIKSLHETEGVKYSDMVVLTRTNAQTRPLEEKFIKGKIPYRSMDGSFYESANVRDMICYLRLLVRDDLDAMKRVFNRPNRFLGKVFWDAFYRRAAGGADLLRLLRGGGFPKPFMDRNASTFGMELTALRNNLAQASPGQAIKVVRQVFEYDAWVKKNDMDCESRLEILNELESSSEGYPSIAEYLEFVDLIVAAQNKTEEFDAVRIMTVHRSKGLESQVVFVAGVSEGVLPHARAEDVEEERRLCYVALTRAIQRLYVSCMLTRFNKALAPSTFLGEMELERYTGTSVEKEVVHVEVA